MSQLPATIAAAGTAAALVLLSACGGTHVQTATRSSEAVAEAPAKAAPQSSAAAARVTAFWTEARMRSARPVDTLVLAGKADRSGDPDAPVEAGGGAPGRASGATGERGAPSRPVPGVAAPIREGAAGFPYRRYFWHGRSGDLPASSVGKLFFKGADGKHLYSCSGAVVAATNRSLVWTAGHCLYDPKLHAYSTSVIFVPGFASWKAPFGVWSERTLIVLKGWQQGSHRYDLGALVLERKDGHAVQSVVGAQGIRWRAAGRPLVDDFGYPGEGQYNGRSLVVCEAQAGAKAYPDKDVIPDGPAVIGIGCDMTEGASGGPWIADLKQSRGWGYVTSVNSFRYSDSPLVLYGPYQGRGARNLYDYAEKR